MSLASNHSFIAPETIDVDDYFVILDGNGHTNPDFGNSSPDELNIRSQSIEGAFPSEEAFHTPGLSSIVWNNNPPIAPDGENIEWAKKDSQVKEKVAKIEAKTRMEDEPNGIDLRTTLKTKDKMKIKVCPIFISSWLTNKVWFVFQRLRAKNFQHNKFPKNNHAGHRQVKTFYL